MKPIKEPLSLLAASVLLLVLTVAFLFARPVLAALVLGWLRVVERVGPRIEVSPIGVATGLACIAAVVAGLHYFGAWLYGEIRSKQVRTDWPASWRWTWTLCLTAAVMLMFIAGLVGVGLYRTSSWFLETPVIFTKEYSF